VRVTPSMRKVCSCASAAHSAIAVNESAPATTAHNQLQDHRQLVAHAPAMPRVSHPGQHLQQARLPYRGATGELNQVAESRVDQ
jgi:hypothetical protein